MERIFSGKGSTPFWDAVNASHNRNVLYEYGIKAQELEAENARLREALEYAQHRTSDDKIFQTIEAALHPKPPEPSKDGFPF